MSKNQDRYKEDYVHVDLDELDELETEKFEKFHSKKTPKTIDTKKLDKKIED